ncbi:Erythrocyte membrane binding protein [Staphylococcus aureus]|uniref:Erythrocyte membrane binding protein n=1 Tax=Staphylococcus aureus TaxID=1280 RepID=A0A2X2K0A1_STAAU|nr:Erythrocyte membrane binding protein [Staphylococcus aureus]
MVQCNDYNQQSQIKNQTKASENYIDADPTNKTAFDNAITQAESYLNKDHGANKDKQAVEPSNSKCNVY